MKLTKHLAARCNPITPQKQPRRAKPCSSPLPNAYAIQLLAVGRYL